ncbi:MAG: DUF3536 domain-containing protein [Acidobacteriota bacterium]|nr:DUF3536 domain-containing protein [Blastocatellia bacterium]MDW8411404.1 DUF3536 domain-containing protein [Acidobacteriota bacterium]
MSTYLTVHCHFYQPPRENPWLETIEKQDSAEPYHDWNERINSECYTPNGWARILDPKGRIEDIVNNYRYISFNVGPTLMSWLQEAVPTTYERILEADKKSLVEHNGHGNAIAQVYNHIIMPLANRRDKVTQVRWGLADFEYRFKRSAESIWLAETAVDYATLEVLVDHNIRYIILSPYQAARVRPLGQNNWIDVSNGQIDPTRPYRCFLRDRRFIDIFFYDGYISQAISFDDLLTNAERLVDRLAAAIVPSRTHRQLINVATDGETYGHHKPFADMALAYALTREAKKRGFILTNYGEFLALNPPQWEVELKPVSSWSCAHGVARWEDDCGCSTGGQPGWHQKWRKPLRKALDWLRDELALRFESLASQFFDDPWQARNDYINVILNRNHEAVKAFLARNCKRKLNEEEVSRALLLMEMQRNCLLMYTSCAWFFSEISGIETVQVLRYAARSIQLAEQLTGEKLEEIFLKHLELAPSNLPEFRTGAGVYRKLVKPSIIDLEHIVNFYAISSLFEDYPRQHRLFCFEAERLDYQRFNIANLSVAIGRIKIKSTITYSSGDFVFGLLHAGERDFYCAVRHFPGIASYRKAKNKFLNSQDKTLIELLQEIHNEFGPRFFSFRDLFIEKRRDIIRRVSDELLNRLYSVYEKLYEENARIIKALKADGMPVPMEYRVAAEYVLGRRLNQKIHQLTDLYNPESFSEILDIAKEARENGYKLNCNRAAKRLSEALLEKVKQLNTLDDNILHDASTLIALANKLQLKLDISRAQEVYLAYLEKILLKKKRKQTDEFVNPATKLAALDLALKLNLSIDKFTDKR